MIRRGAPRNVIPAAYNRTSKLTTPPAIPPDRTKSSFPPDRQPAKEVTPMPQAPAFSSAAEAADLARAGLRYLAAADPAQLTISEQAECLHDLERITAVTTAARANVLGGFTAGHGYTDDADYSPRSWLIHKTRITKGAATGHTAWVRRARAHPRIMAVLAAGEMSESRSEE